MSSVGYKGYMRPLKNELPSQNEREETRADKEGGDEVTPER